VRGESSQPRLADQPRPQPEKTVTCRGCGHTLTRSRWCLPVGGSPEHTFRNPAGYSFHVVCYSQAPGCLNAGVPSSEATWFAGYQWSFALCSACHAHVGWWYQGAREPSLFAGLIATRLVRS
jgi:hypothetical protein